MRIKTSAVWNQPRDDMAFGCRHFGYVLFRSDDEMGSVLVSHTVDPTLRKGDHFWEKLGLNKQEVRNLRNALVSDSTCWLISDLGIGMLFNAYDVWLGMFVYIHIYEDPRVLRRLLKHDKIKLGSRSILVTNRARARGDVTEEDMAVLAELEGSLDALRDIKRLSCFVNEDSQLPLTDLLHYVSSLKPLLDCRIDTSLPDIEDGNRTLTTVTCHHPFLMEGAILHWLALARDVSLDKRLAFRVSTAPGDYGEAVTLTVKTLIDFSSYDTAVEEKTERFWEEMFHMFHKSELCGINIRFAADGMPVDSSDVPLPSPFRYREALKRYVSFIPQKKCLLSIDMTFTRNLFKHPLPFFKTNPDFRYDDLEE